MSLNASRRTFLRLGGAAAAVPALHAFAGSSSASAAGTSAAVAAAGLPVPATWSAAPVPLGDVVLRPGLYAQKQARMLDFARGYDPERMLLVFRANANLDTGDAEPVAAGGWEGLDGEANGNLRGHFGGHYLSMVSQAAAGTGDAELVRQVDVLVDGLAEVQRTLAAGPLLRSVPGRFARAVDNQRGSFLHLDLPTSTVQGQEALTFAAWVRPSATQAWARLLDAGTTKDGSYLFVAPADDTGSPRLAITTRGAGGEQVVRGTGEVPVDRWSHLAVTLDGTTGVIYLDGAEVGRGDVSLTPADLGALTSAWVGRSRYDDPTFAGAVEDVNLWSRALTATEVAQLQSRTAATAAAGAGDLASYSCTERAGTRIADASGRGRHATLARTWGDPSHPGFLAAYPETQFIDLETRTRSDYTVVWAPYYTAHKILKGLLDAHTLAGNATALDVARGLGDWMHSRLSKLSPSTLQRMWSLFSSGEFGGLTEAVADLYALTGDPRHLELGRFLDLDSLIDACAEDRDTLTGLHANQHIPIFTGLARMHDHTGEQRYLDAARNFFAMVVPHRTYAIGGTSLAEFWKERDVVAGALADTSAETCCAHNLAKLSRMLFLHDQDPAYMDYFERVQLNQLLGARQDVDDAELPLTTYFLGQQPGAVRDFTPKAGTTCCEGTGMESLTKLQDTVYLVDDDADALLVNLFVPSTVRWRSKGVRVVQATRFPEVGATRLTVRGAGRFTLRLRVPAWAVRGYAVTVNGLEQRLRATPGSYVSITRRWSDGDEVRVTMPFSLRAEPTPDDPGLQALMYGPVHLVARDAATTERAVSLYQHASLSGDLSRALTPITGRPLHFTLGGLRLAPFFEGTTDAFHSYLRRTEPAIVFPGRDSGVANTAGADGRTFLDAVWARAPFADRGALVRAVRTEADARVAAGSMTAGDAERVVTSAERSPIRP